MIRAHQLVVRAVLPTSPRRLPASAENRPAARLALPATMASNLEQDNGRRLDCFLTMKVPCFNSLACDLIRRLPHRAVMLDSR